MTDETQLLARDILAESAAFDGDFWTSPGYSAAIENWNELAVQNEVHAAIGTTHASDEEAKSQGDLGFVMAQAKPGMRVLDVGCGYGRIAKYLLPQRKLEAYVGLDSSRVMLKKFQARYAARVEEQGTPLILVNADIDRLPIRDASIDLCIVSAVFLHNPKDITKRSVAEILRVLKQGGCLLAIGSFPNAHSLDGMQNWAYLRYLDLIGKGKKNGPVRHFSPGELRRLMRGFQDVKIVPSGFVLFPKTILVMPPRLRHPFRQFHRRAHGFLERHTSADFRKGFGANFEVIATKAGAVAERDGG